MKLSKKNEGWNWKAEDEAGLHISGTGNLTVPPETVEAHRIGHVCLVLPPTQKIELARLEYLGRGFFGEGRPGGGSSKWTGDAYKFAVYAYKEESALQDRAVIMRQDGGGSYFYLVDQLDAGKTFRALCQTLTSELLWDVLITLCKTYDEGTKHGREKMGKLFLQDRLKKKRKGNTVRLEVISEAEVARKAAKKAAKAEAAQIA